MLHMYTSIWVQKLLGKELKGLVNSDPVQVSQKDFEHMQNMLSGL